MSSELIKHISDASFESDVLQADKPVLVDYWAEWCGPCKMIAPILDEAAKDYNGRAAGREDERRREPRNVPAKFGIRGIPTLMLFKERPTRRHEGRRLSKAQLTAFSTVIYNPSRRSARFHRVAGLFRRSDPATTHGDRRPATAGAGSAR